MIKSILSIYYEKIKLIPTIVNNIFYYSITIKLRKLSLNCLAMIFITLNLVFFYPASVIVNLLNILYFKLTDSGKKYIEYKNVLKNNYIEEKKKITLRKKEYLKVLN